MYSQTDKLRLLVSGNSKQQTEIIDSIGYQKTHSDFNALNSEFKTLKKDLSLLGFFDLTELESLQKKDSIYFSKIDIGNRYKKITLYIPNNQKALRQYIERLSIPIRNDSIEVDTPFAKAFLEQLSLLASEDGKPFTSFQFRQITKKSKKILAGILHSTEDTTRYIDNIVIKDYENISQGFLKYYAGFKTGKAFNQSELITQSDALDKLPFITIKKDPEVLFTNDSTTVYVYASRKSNNRFDGFIGFATNEETNRLRLDGYLDLVLTNNLNYGEQLTLNYKSDGDDQQQLNIKATLPYLFKSPIGAEFQLALFRKDSTFSETSQTVSLFYQLGRQTKASLGYKRKQSENLQDNFTNTNILNYTQDRVLGAFDYTVLENNVLFPERTVFNTTLEAGVRNTDNMRETQFSIDTKLQHTFKLNAKNHIFLRNKTQTLISDNFLTNELFRFGGIISIRGFEENSIFANLQSTLNTEYRYILAPTLYIHSIIDAGYFENELLDQRSRLFSIGFGAGILTKSGVFKINIANGRNEDQELLLSNTRIHLRLEARF